MSVDRGFTDQISDAALTATNSKAGMMNGFVLINGSGARPSELLINHDAPATSNKMSTPAMLAPAGFPSDAGTIMAPRTTSSTNHSSSRIDHSTSPISRGRAARTSGIIGPV